jgi:hypothetical protein
MLATVVGAAAGMILSFPLNYILVAALGTKVTTPWTTTETALIVLFKGAEGGMMGMGVGLGQWWVFRKHLKQTGGWVLATGLALFIQGAFRWSLPSDIPAWQVGVSTMLSFGVFLGLCQWFVLRGRVPHAEWWIAVSIAGWVATFAVHAVSEYAQFSFESFLGMVFIAVEFLVPLAVAGGGMVWLLRQTAPASQAAAS